MIVRAPSAGRAALRITLAPGSAALDLPQEGTDYVVRMPVNPGDNPVQLREPGGRVEVKLLALEP